MKNKSAAHIRAFIRPIKGYSLDAQRAVVKGANIVYRGDDDEREDWIRALRPDEIAMISRLDVLPPVKRPKGLRASVDFVTALHAVQSKCAYIIEASSGVTSRDGKRWLQQIEAAMNRIVAGRTLSTERAKAMQRERQRRAPAGIVRSKRDDAEWLARWGPVWRDSGRTLAQKREALPDDVRQCSFATLYRIFEASRPDLKTGRPRKAKRKR